MKFREGSYGFFAERDYEDFKDLYDLKPFKISLMAYCAQQSVEKYFKHYLCVRSKEPSRDILSTHNLSRLGRVVEYPGLNKFNSILSFMSDLYFSDKYPDMEGKIWVQPTLQDLKEINEVLEDVRKWVLEMLESTEENIHTNLHKMDLF